jgi:periplasmic divalent cation tolerance protein
MKSIPNKGIVVLVTCGSAKEAKMLAQTLVHRRLAACVNMLPGRVASIYRWKNRAATAKEVLLLIKTSQSRLRNLENEILRIHSYDIPEIIALPIAAGSKSYLCWLEESIQPVRRRSKKK